MTLQQIAERAGVSTPTISKVLNGRPDVAPATRERVLQVLHEQQYLLPRGGGARVRYLSLTDTSNWCLTP